MADEQHPQNRFRADAAFSQYEMNAALEHESSIMNRLAATVLRIVPTALRVSMAMLLLAAPVLAVPLTSPPKGAVLEAPKAPKVGAGLVLVVSLQRA